MALPPIMRLYQPAWNQLKSYPNTALVISAVPALHARIYKAVIKEKYKDTLFHTEMDFQGYSTKLSKISKGNALSITLHIIPSVENALS